ncbi:beta-1,3-galactosyltransferase brn-like [Pecten maximus]|uniref:beta-1,3-galactosyltransferase brn-like n=1 Tax=Pecten maximus TaxID=6579 RepID=UPI0014590F46|nr:beta-1,3-galactosyltransferase brn-like [Pecten maximus]XP_033757180.1 beta-1,3-galactosyltransferase brn-like [Pecten maximus]
MKNQHYLSWILRRFRSIGIAMLLLLSILIVLFFLEDTTLVHSYNKRISLLFQEVNHSSTIPKPRNYTSFNVPIITKSRPITVPRLNKTSQQLGKHRPQSMTNFNYPLDIDLLYFVKRNIENGTAINIKPINPHLFRYLHKPAKCSFSEPGDAVKLLVLVKSAVLNIELREGIRNTWGKDMPSNVRIVFLLGNTDNKNQKRIREEGEKYSDVIQEDFLDKYQNNTYKTIMGFNWGVTFCSSASFFFFVDDDHYAFLANVYKYLESVHYTKPNLLSGYLLPHSKPYRDVKSKWFVSWEDYGFDWWPPYLAGGAYIVSFSIAQKFHIAFPYVKYIGIDDSYLGIVAKRLGIRPTHNRYFANRATFPTTDKIRRLNMFASHGFKNPKKMKKVWDMLHVNDTTTEAH